MHDIHNRLERLQKQVNIHAFWDGFRIRAFRRRRLVVSGSQDWTYFHQLDIVFRNVTFFNLPSMWSDDRIHGSRMIRLADPNEFLQNHPGLDIGDRHVFAFDVHHSATGSLIKDTFFVVASDIHVFVLDEPAGDGTIHYKDPIPDAGFLEKRNRIPLLRRSQVQ